MTIDTGWVTMNLAQADDLRVGGLERHRHDRRRSSEGARRAIRSGRPTTSSSTSSRRCPRADGADSPTSATPHKAWINGTGAFKTTTITHEMGHNYGLLHAASLRCATSIGGACSSSEYGDPFDAMGNQRAMHYNAMQKSKLAWIPSTSVRTHTGGSATYTLSPLEVARRDDVRSQDSDGGSNRTYWLEFRQPIGFDSPAGGLPQQRRADPRLVSVRDAVPGMRQQQRRYRTARHDAVDDAVHRCDAADRPDVQRPTYGINVTVLSASASALTVQVGTGGAAPPPAPTATTTSIAATPNPSFGRHGRHDHCDRFAVARPLEPYAFTDNGVAIAGCAAIA